MNERGTALTDSVHSLLTAPSNYVVVLLEAKVHMNWFRIMEGVFIGVYSDVFFQTLTRPQNFLLVDHARCWFAEPAEVEVTYLAGKLWAVS